MESSLVFYNNVPRESIELSIIIPTYKNQILLNSAVKSVIELSNNFGIRFELIVMINDPEAETNIFIERYGNFSRFPFLVYRNKNNYGQVGNINQGVILSSGKYIAFLHDDDLLLPNYLDEIAIFVRNSQFEFGCITTSYYELYEKHRVSISKKLFLLLLCYRLLYRKKTTKVSIRDAVKSFRDIYGAPTCGCLFTKEKLVDFKLFSNINGAAWDFKNLREFNKKNNIYILHSYVGIKRKESGMSIKETVQNEFRHDTVEFYQEYKDSDWFLRTFGPSPNKKKFFLKRVVFRIKCSLYFYLHNLDCAKLAPYKIYREVNK